MFYLFFLLMPFQASASDYLENNLEMNSLKTNRESLMLDQKISHSLFLPDLSLNGGLGYEKLVDGESFEKNTGPFLFLESKINLYRGGADSLKRDKTKLLLSQSDLEEEIKRRELKVLAYKLNSEIDWLKKDNLLIEDELKNNNQQQGMARKKVDAGLSTNVDLLDFELKKENLSNDLASNILKIEELEKEIESKQLKNIVFQEGAQEVTLESTDFNNGPGQMLVNEQLKISELEKKNAKADSLPTIDLKAAYGQITPQEKFLNKDKEHQFFLNITIPLFQGFSSNSKIQQASISGAQQERVARQLEIDTRINRDLELKKINLAKKILASLERSLSQSIKYRDLTIGEYRRGIKNSPDLISASDKKFEIERKKLAAYFELKTTTYSYNETFRPYKGASQ